MSVASAKIAETTLFSSIYNDYTETEYHEVLDLFMRRMAPRVKERGGELIIQRDWSDGAVNAWAWREGDAYYLEIPGGAARYHLINEEAFVLTLCHELGHLMGGYPASEFMISYEGQADYFATSKCAALIFEDLKADEVLLPELIDYCRSRGNNDLVCPRSLKGALSLTAYYAELEGRPAPTLSTPSKEVARSTQRQHPKAQCRLDSFVAGALCPVPLQEDFSYKNATQGACHPGYFSEFQRPVCWFKE